MEGAKIETQKVVDQGAESNSKLLITCDPFSTLPFAAETFSVLPQVFLAYPYMLFPSLLDYFMYLCFFIFLFIFGTSATPLDSSLEFNDVFI